MNDQNASVHAHNRGKARGEAKERARIATQLRAEADRRRASDRDDMEPEIDTAVARALEDAADSVERGADDIRARQLPEGESIDSAFADALRRAADIFERAGKTIAYGEAWESGRLAGASKFNVHMWAARRLRSWADGMHGYTPGPRQASPVPPRGEGE